MMDDQCFPKTRCWFCNEDTDTRGSRIITSGFLDTHPPLDRFNIHHACVEHVSLLENIYNLTRDERYKELYEYIFYMYAKYRPDLLISCL